MSEFLIKGNGQYYNDSWIPLPFLTIKMKSKILLCLQGYKILIFSGSNLLLLSLLLLFGPLKRQSCYKGS